MAAGSISSQERINPDFANGPANRLLGTMVSYWACAIKAAFRLHIRVKQEHRDPMPYQWIPKQIPIRQQRKLPGTEEMATIKRSDSGKTQMAMPLMKLMKV